MYLILGLLQFLADPSFSEVEISRSAPLGNLLGLTWIKTFGFARLLLIVRVFLWFEHICRNCFLIYGLWFCTSDRVLKTVLAHSTWSSELKGKAFVHYAGTYSMFVWAYLAIGVSYSSHHYFADSLVTDMIISMHYWIL